MRPAYTPISMLKIKELFLADTPKNTKHCTAGLDISSFVMPSRQAMVFEVHLNPPCSHLFPDIEGFNMRSKNQQPSGRNETSAVFRARRAAAIRPRPEQDALRFKRPRRVETDIRQIRRSAGTAAAVGNAIYHATGKRVRDFPITLDKLMNA